MKAFRSTSFQLLLLTAATVLATSAAIALNYQGRMRALILSDMEERGWLLARRLAVDAEYPLLIESRDLLSASLDAVAGAPGIRCVAVLDERGIFDRRGTAAEDGKGLPAAGGEPGRPVFGDGVCWFSVPVLTAGGTGGEEMLLDAPRERKRIGWVHVGIDLSPTWGRIRAALTEAAGFALLVALVVGAASMWMGNRLWARPLRRVAEGLRRFSGGDLEFRLEPQEASRELALLSTAFNRMGDDLQSARRSLMDLNISLEERILRRTKELEEATREVQAKAADLERSNAELEQFAYIASHDLREPLRIIASYVQILEEELKGKLDERTGKHLLRIVKNARRMQGMVQDLLDYSRVGHGELKTQPVDAGALLSDVIGDLRKAIDDSGGRVEAETLPVVRANPVQLAHVFQNLIANALKFRGEAPPLVRVGAGLKDGRWLFSVSDNGIGFDPRFAGRIFRMFQRLHERDRYEGTGIGLSIAKKIVEHHGGEIWAESEPGKGSTFRFTIPA